MLANKNADTSGCTHCVHVASQEKHQHRVLSRGVGAAENLRSVCYRRLGFIKQNETSRCNIIYISYNAYNAITRSEIQWL